jgi:hypothetical protein
MKKMLFGIAILAALLFALSPPATADKPGNMTSFDSIWVGPTSTHTDDPNTTPGSGDVYISGDLIVGGGVDISGAAKRRDIYFDLAGAGIDGGNDVDDASTPDITSHDGVPTIVWATSAEVAAVQWTFRVPSDYSSGMVFYALVSSNAASGAGQKLGWGLTVNGAASFGAVAAQTAVEATSATLNASCEVLTLTCDATAEALFVAGKWITIDIYNASTDDDDLELKGLQGSYVTSY